MLTFGGTCPHLQQQPGQPPKTRDDDWNRRIRRRRLAQTLREAPHSTQSLPPQQARYFDVALKDDDGVLALVYTTSHFQTGSRTCSIAPSWRRRRRTLTRLRSK
jgi:hypothetical protein